LQVSRVFQTVTSSIQIIANLLYKVTEESVGFFRARGTPVVMKVVDIMGGMMQARAWKSVPNISQLVLEYEPDFIAL
jgi:hypothetical protein